MSVGLDWQTVVKAAGTLGVGGAAVKFAPDLLRWVMGGRARKEHTVLSTAQSRETDATAGLIRAKTEDQRVQTAGDIFDLLTRALRQVEMERESRRKVEEQLEATKSDLNELKRRVDDMGHEQVSSRDRIAVLLEDLVEEQKRSSMFEEQWETAVAGLAHANERITVLEGQVATLKAENAALRGGRE